MSVRFVSLRLRTRSKCCKLSRISYMQTIVSECYSGVLVLSVGFLFASVASFELVHVLAGFSMSVEFGFLPVVVLYGRQCCTASV